MKITISIEGDEYGDVELSKEVAGPFRISSVHIDRRDGAKMILKDLGAQAEVWLNLNVK